MPYIYHYSRRSGSRGSDQNRNRDVREPRDRYERRDDNRGGDRRGERRDDRRDDRRGKNVPILTPT